VKMAMMSRKPPTADRLHFATDRCWLFGVVMLCRCDSGKKQFGANNCEPQSLRLRHRDLPPKNSGAHQSDAYPSVVRENRQRRHRPVSSLRYQRITGDQSGPQVSPLPSPIPHVVDVR
jgi:hypothetical protein